ncbi:hypothetical protein FCL47_09935 [Desulfopila sp. IMCC35006]|nr:hypothetical protein FCL47_09935 [Desulfopila sp. IMCC35006]
MDDEVALTLFYAGSEYKAKVTLSNGRTRLFWSESLAEVLRRQFPDCYESFKDNAGLEGKSPVLRFEKYAHGYPQHYNLEFVSRSDVQQDIEGEMAEEEAFPEGAPKEYYGKRYERNPANRMRAIEIHGTRCKGCGFDFEAVYGERGRGFIEVHHTKPLYLNQKEQTVDPVKDLLPVCSNCHRMIHRRKDDVMTIEQIQKMLS